ncbi:MAG: hypothetical protein KAI47_19900, partial [Deltaproteobacteria bacterium]|nr:hypothetical protein [Deltaproteobacteria bacterium]
YCSFWVIGLARRAGKAPDPLALNYLKTLDGDRWYDFLARFALGKLTSANLEKQAKTLSQRTEAAYYQADRLLAGGKIAEAKTLWKRVVDSQLMAFFEYDMAMSQLHHGPAKIRTQPVDRRKK